jgi:hypothetical protein
MRRLILPVLALLTPTAANADVVCEWMEFAYKIVEAQPNPPAGTPREPDHARAVSQTALAMFEALNAIEPRYESYLKLATVSSKASKEAAAATAAHAILSSHFPGNKAALEDSLAIALEAVTDPGAREAGRAAGAAAAAAVLKRDLIDPQVAATPYRPRATPGVWVPTALPVIEPWSRTLKPWFVTSSTQFAPPPPPPLASEVWARDFNEVKRLGGRKSTERTPHQTLMARYRITPNMMPMLRTIADQNGRNLVDNARLFALMEMVADDAGQTNGQAKLAYNFWRPITAIRNAEGDGNPATQPDDGWAPLINTPNHPEYPCGHCTFAAAYAGVLKAEVGNTPPGGVRVASYSIPQSAVQVVPSLDAWVKDVSLSRILGGVHYRFSNDAGEAVGRNVADYALANFMRPLPARKASKKS